MSVAADDRLPRPSTRIGRYELRERLGSGGMGEVWLAEQTEPVRRRVALKLIKAGMDTRDVIARFEHERQALALMNHPGIAAVLDAGATPDGRPYFVMEHVPGTPIRTYCDTCRLTIAQRVELFLKVCRAVQHAHIKGVIHRDIKPNNVLVVPGDSPAAAAPKVIDFGISKAAGAAADQPALTLHGAFIGTPEYMSPEQTSAGPSGVDTRADVYSLGAVLYELLTGAVPLSREALMRAGLTGVAQAIRDLEPVRPSVRLRALADPPRRPATPSPTAAGSTRPTVLPSAPALDAVSPSEPPATGATGPAVIQRPQVDEGRASPSLAERAFRRGTSPAGLVRAVRGDLDWIVMRCLEKDRERRYATVAELSADLERHLGGLPILARPPSRTYRVGKLLKRHRVAAIAACTVALLLTGAGTATIIAVREARRQVDIEARSRDYYLDGYKWFHEGSYAQALAALERSLELRGDRRDVALLRAQALSRLGRRTAAIDAAKALLDDRATSAAANRLLAELYRGVDAAAAADHLEKGRAPGELSSTQEYLLAVSSEDAGVALAHLDRAIDLDPQHYDALVLRSYLRFAAGRHRESLDDAKAAQTLRPKDARAVYNLGVTQQRLGVLPEARRCYQNAIELDAGMFAAWHNLGAVAYEMHDFAAAEAAFNEALRLNPRDARPLAHRAQALEQLARVDEALDIYRELEANGFMGRNWIVQAAVAAHRAGRWELAVSEAIRAARASENTRTNADDWHRVAWVLLTAPAGRERTASYALAVVEKLRAEAPETGGLAGTLALAYVRNGRLDDARTAARAAAEADPDSPDDRAILALALADADKAAARTAYDAAMALLNADPAKATIATRVLLDEVQAAIGSVP